MDLGPTSDSVRGAASSAARPERERRWLFILVVLGLAVQVAIASAAFVGPRPTRFGWQMYTAVPYKPIVWTVSGNDRTSVDIDDLLINARAEIDFVAFIRSRGCDLLDGDVLHIKHPDGPAEVVTC